MGRNVLKYNASWTGSAFHLCPPGYEYKCIRGPVGCLPAGTEVMTPRGWVRIEAYSVGTQVLQWDSGTGVCRFAVPREYVVGECGSMLRFDCGRRFSMTVTGSHRVPLYGWDGRFVVKTADALRRRLSRHVVPTTWRNGGDGVGMSDDELRLWVAVAADGSYPKRGCRCEFAFRKRRKVERLEAMLERMGVWYRKYVRVRRDKDGAEEVHFTIRRPSFPKHLDWRLASCTARQAEVVVDEMRHWDGLYGYSYDRFSSTNAMDCEIVQYLAHSCGRNATVSRCPGRREGHSAVWNVHIAKVGSAMNRVGIRCDGTAVSEVRPPDGRQYCFVTDTGFFVVRQEGHVFVTGNSGKSVTCCWDIRLKSDDQKVAEVVEDGVKKRIRWSKWAVCRHSYPALVNTTIETYLQWFPQTSMHMSSPMTGRLEEPSMKGDGTIVRIDFVFLALESKNIRNDIMSLELSGAFVNEATQVPWRIIDELHGRIGRFQPCKGVELDSFGVIMDTNSPDESNWWYRKEMVEKPQGMVFFVQPPALLMRTKDGRTWYEDNDGRDFGRFGIRAAENVENLREGFYYWHKQTVGADPDKVKRLILNQFGTSIDGRPVYPEYNDAIHCCHGEIAFQRGLTVLLGSDFGRTPATVIAQLGLDGVLYVLDEVTAENMSAEQFIEELLRPKLMNEYGFPNCPHINFGDPAGMNFNEVVSVSAIQTFNRYGILTKPAPATNGNRFQIRIDAVSELLRRNYKGRAAVQISDRCRMLRKGFNGYYCYRRIKTGADGDERYTEEADKNSYSHIHDAFQYLCMGTFRSGVDYSVPGSPSSCGVDFSPSAFDMDFGFV